VKWDQNAISYFFKHREYVLRDLKALQNGTLRIADEQGDATERWISRYRRQLGYIDELISAYEASTEH
jgi:hypothetical protein